VDVDWTKEINLFFSFLFYSILIHLLDELWLEELDEVVWEDAHPPLQLTLPPALVLHIPAITENLYNCVGDFLCCGSGMFNPDPGYEFFPFQIPDPNFSIQDPRSASKEFKYFNPKKSSKYVPGCSSQIRIPDPDFLPIPDPGFRGQKGRIRNTGDSMQNLFKVTAILDYTMSQYN
jgi:hypothetical protein